MVKTYHLLAPREAPPPFPKLKTILHFRDKLSRKSAPVFRFSQIYFRESI